MSLTSHVDVVKGARFPAQEIESAGEIETDIILEDGRDALKSKKIKV